MLECEMVIVRLHIADFQRDGRPDSLVWRDWLGDRLVLDNGVYVFLDPCPADPRRHGAMLPINALPVKKGFPAFVRGNPLLHVSIHSRVITRLPNLSPGSKHRIAATFLSLEVTAQSNLPRHPAHNNLNGGIVSWRAAVEEHNSYKISDGLRLAKLSAGKSGATTHSIENQDSSLSESVGESFGWKRALKQVETVADTDSTVLFLGETGTGKELLARRIHSLSPRRDRTLVITSCASIPAGLFESELFGHEKGAFTGAIGREVGRFELANGGTIFLDEVGDIPLECQSKLLRVLQEHEFERLGSHQTIQTNFRLVAATNRDLRRMVEKGRFRRDLFYRVNVFPIEVPALRERKDDIPSLAWHFAKKYAKRMQKSIESIRVEDMKALVRYEWPGNVRELQNVMERCVILSTNAVLYPPLLADVKRTGEHSGPMVQTLADAERKHILQTLFDTDWVIGGADGAALRLGVKRTTLLYKMRRLEITRPN